MATPFAKIAMKNTTAFSLNERFTAYRQQSQNAAFFRQKLQFQGVGSVENRSLARQMANRPSVIAALRLKRRSLHQRLGHKRIPSLPGGSVKSRLDFSRNYQGRFINNRGRNIQWSRRGRFQGFRNNFYRPGTSPMDMARPGTPAFDDSLYNRSYGSRNFGRGTVRGRYINPRYIGYVRRAVGNRRGPMFTKEQLDEELETYMAEKTPVDN